MVFCFSDKKIEDEKKRRKTENAYTYELEQLIKSTNDNTNKLNKASTWQETASRVTKLV